MAHSETVDVVKAAGNLRVHWLSSGGDGGRSNAAKIVSHMSISMLVGATMVLPPERGHSYKSSAARGVINSIP